jgi:hypothetical protein
MIKEFQYSFEDLGLVNGDIEELLGFEDGIIPEPFPELIEFALNHSKTICKIRGGYKIFNAGEIYVDKKNIRIGKQVFNPSKVVTTQFKNATSFAIFICTAGAEISKHSREVSANGDPLLSFVFDVIGSVTVEKVTDKIQESLETEMQTMGLNISDRFSPGYCEWSVAEQQNLFALMPVNFCGVSLSESSLMSPIKSVSGIIAIGAVMEQKGYQCHWCTEKNCMYGKIKRQKKI